MTGADSYTFYATEVGATGVWLATTAPPPPGVFAELADFSGAPPDAQARRGVADMAADLGAMVASGVIGNAAWDALPLTAAFLRARFSQQGNSNIDYERAVETVVTAARSAYGSRSAVHVDRAERLADGSWDVTFSIDGADMFAKVQGDGQLVLWTA